MRIVFLSFLHGFGGAEKQNIALANELAERGHDVYLVSLYVDNVCYPLSEKVKYIYLPDRFSGTINILYRYLDIKDILNKIKPDITVHFWFQTAYLTAFMPKSITGKIIYSERGDPYDNEYKGILGLIRYLSLPRIDWFVFQSSGAQSYFNQKVKLRSTIIMNPIFLKCKLYPFTKERSKKIVTVGRLHRQKNQKLLIHSFSKIAHKLPNYQLEIYGEGPLKSELEIQIKNLHLENQVFLRGTSSDIHKKIYDAGLFVLSSDYEGLPNTLLEAMALGIPCISTDCRPGGARQIIDHLKNGLITPLGDDVALAEAILWMLTHEKESLLMGKKASDKMKELNAENIYNQWEKCFEGVLK